MKAPPSAVEPVAVRRVGGGSPPRVDSIAKMYPEFSRDGSRLPRRSPSVMKTLEILGDKWAFAILVETYYGVNKFDDYQHNLEISRNVLTKRLGVLVGEGILHRVRYQVKPDRYEYRLTNKGREMYPIFLAIQQWGDQYFEAGQESDLHLVHTTCGQPTTPHLCCDSCGEEVVVSAIRLVVAESFD